MDDITLNCSESVKKFVQQEIASGACATPDEVVEKLVDEEKKRRARISVEALLDKAIASGDAVEMTAQDWNDIRAEVHRRATRRNGTKP